MEKHSSHWLMNGTKDNMKRVLNGAQHIRRKNKHFISSEDNYRNFYSCDRLPFISVFLSIFLFYSLGIPEKHVLCRFVCDFVCFELNSIEIQFY